MQRPFILLVILLFVFMLPSALWAGTVKFQHHENQFISLSDAAFPEEIKFQVSTLYKNRTIFELPEASFHFLMVTVNKARYYLWVTAPDVEIDLQNIQLGTFVGYNLLSSENWRHSVDNASSLQSIAVIDAYYTNALASLHAKAQSDPKYRNSMLYDELVWDNSSAKRLYNYAVSQYSAEFDPAYVLYSSAYMAYWELLYKLFYKYYHTNSFKGLSHVEAYSRLNDDLPAEGTNALFLIHFFRDGTSLPALKENYEKLKNKMSPRQMAYVKSRIFSEQTPTAYQKTDFIFGIDIDAALQGFYVRDTSDKQNVLIFWSYWDQQSERELLLLRHIDQKFQSHYNFIYICIDSESKKEKVKAMIYRNRINGFHLIPESSVAFQKSLYKKSLKIRALPYYVLTDPAGNIIASEELSVDVSDRLIKKLEHYSLEF